MFLTNVNYSLGFWKENWGYWKQIKYSSWESWGYWRKSKTMKDVKWHKYEERVKMFIKERKQHKIWERKLILGLK
jgi:hypothetical protein